VIDGEYSCEKTDSTQTVVGKEDIWFSNQDRFRLVVTCFYEIWQSSSLQAKMYVSPNKTWWYMGIILMKRESIQRVEHCATCSTF
jgi:hypothetical protein